jgi:translation initiation factor 1
MPSRSAQGPGQRCLKCGWPATRCTCSSNQKKAVAPVAIPDRITAKLRIEKAGRGGKTVSVVDALPNDKTFLKELAGELKKACGSGGTVGEGRVEIQGEQLETIRPLLIAKGWIVKG